MYVFFFFSQTTQLYSLLCENRVTIKALRGEVLLQNAPLIAARTPCLEGKDANMKVERIIHVFTFCNKCYWKCFFLTIKKITQSGQKVSQQSILSHHQWLTF